MVAPDTGGSLEPKGSDGSSISLWVLCTGLGLRKSPLKVHTGTCSLMFRMVLVKLLLRCKMYSCFTRVDTVPALRQWLVVSKRTHAGVGSVMVMGSAEGGGWVYR